MRETLHQLGVTLALPIAVGAVWITRAERAEPPVRERATAYRVELAELPLPIRERLRPPGFAVGAPVDRQAPKDAAAHRQRPALEVLSELAPVPVDLAAQTDSKRTLVAAPSPRAAHETPGALPALSAAPLIALAAPPLSSRRGTAPASTSTALPSSGNPGLIPGREPVRVGVPAKIVDELPPIARRPDGIDPGRLDRFATPDGYRPLGLPSQRGGLAPDLSPPAGRQQPTILPDVPLQVFETAKADALGDRATDFSASPPPTSWTRLRPGLLVLIPEPGSALLFGASLAALGALRRSRRRV